MLSANRSAGSHADPTGADDVGRRERKIVDAGNSGGERRDPGLSEINDLSRFKSLREIDRGCVDKLRAARRDVDRLTNLSDSEFWRDVGCLIQLHGNIT